MRSIETTVQRIANRVIPVATGDTTSNVYTRGEKMTQAKRKHVFDVRSEIHVRDLKRKISHQPVRCIKCKKLTMDPSSSCSFVEKGVESGK
jgi:hypothetical protein